MSKTSEKYRSDGCGGIHSEDYDKAIENGDVWVDSKGFGHSDDGKVYGDDGRCLGDE